MPVELLMRPCRKTAIRTGIWKAKQNQCVYQKKTLQPNESIGYRLLDLKLHSMLPKSFAYSWHLTIIWERGQIIFVEFFRGLRVQVEMWCYLKFWMTRRISKRVKEYRLLCLQTGSVITGCWASELAIMIIATGLKIRFYSGVMFTLSNYQFYMYT